MSGLDKLVPLFTGLNYREWKARMESFLKTQGYWKVVGGTSFHPQRPRGRTVAAAATGKAAAGSSAQSPPTATTQIPPSDEEMAEYRALSEAWTEIDEKAHGAIQLRLSASMLTHVQTTARGTWTTLATIYGTPGVPQIYADFRSLIKTHLSGSNPAPEMDKMATYLNRLAAAECTIPPQLAGMILLGA